MNFTEAECQIFVAASGAGAGIQSVLWKQPGASAYLEGCIFPYSPKQSSKFLGFTPDRFVCREEAIDLAISAYREAADGCPSNKNPIGLGLTASVSSLKNHRGAHRIFAMAISRTRVLSARMTLSKDTLNPRWICRYADGRLADQLGLDLIRAIAGLPVEEEIEVQDDTEFVRQHFLSRPLFRRDGSRELAPSGGVRLYPGAFNPLHKGHLATAPEPAIFHITSNPPHKPALSLQDMLERSIQFRGLRDILFTEGDALYIDKARRFPNSGFIVGTDVVERILDPKWGPEIEPMLQEFKELGAYFYVSPRGDKELKDFLPQIPQEYRSLFTALPRHEFSEMSSTQIRAKLADAVPSP